MLDVRIEVLRGIRIERRSQDAAVAQGSGAELHSPVHPGDDAVIIELAYGRFNQLFGREQIAEVQFAILQHLLDLLGAEAGAETQISHAEPLRLAKDVMPGVEY